MRIFLPGLVRKSVWLVFIVFLGMTDKAIFIENN